MRLRNLKELDGSEGTVRLHESSSSTPLILHPTPNATDPNDPLRWTKLKKHTCFFSVCAFTFLTNYALGGLAPAFHPLSLEFHKTQTEVSGLLLWPLLTLGIFNFFWVPIANYIGKRPVFVLTSLLLCICYVWSACAKTFESLLWSNIIAAFAGSSTEALGAATVGDLYFVHERANFMGMYMNAINLGNTIGPLVCGFIVQSLGWRWHKWIAAILVAINWFLVLLFFPETRYDRSTAAQRKPSTSSRPVEDVESKSSLERKGSEREYETENFQQIPKKTFAQELSLWSGTAKNTSLLRLFGRPWPFVVLPAVIYAFLGYAVSLAWVIAINILTSFVLGESPYYWKPSIYGLINIAGLIGNLIGAWTGGWFVDKYSDWCSRRNGGVFQPESRLHLIWLPALIVPAGCLTWGYAQALELHWTALFFAYGMISFGLTFVPVATMTYVSDSYLPINADALMLVNGLKNVVAFGFLYGVVPWIDRTGPVNAFGTQAGIYVAIMALAIPLIMFGETIRHRSSSWRIVL